MQIAERLAAEEELNHTERVRLVVTLDSDEASGQALAERLVKIGAVEGRRLAALNRESMLQLLRSMLSADVVPERLGELIERSGAGHPGYAIAYTRWLAERGLERSVRTSIIPFLVGTIIIYVFGVAWLSTIVGGLGKAIELGMLPFLFGDAVKLILASLALPLAWKLAKE